MCWQMIARVHNPIDGWGGGPGPHPPSEVKALHATITHVYCHAIQGLYTSVHVGRMACVRALPHWGWGGYGRYPHPRQMQSCHVTSLQSPMCTLQKILSKKTGRTSSPRSLPLRQLLGIYSMYVHVLQTSQVTYRSNEN